MADEIHPSVAPMEGPGRQPPLDRSAPDPGDVELRRCYKPKLLVRHPRNHRVRSDASLNNSPNLADREDLGDISIGSMLMLPRWQRGGGFAAFYRGSRGHRLHRARRIAEITPVVVDLSLAGAIP